MYDGCSSGAFMGWRGFLFGRRPAPCLECALLTALCLGASAAQAQTPDRSSPPSDRELAASPTAQVRTVDFDIPAGPLGDALTRLARQGDLQVLFEPELVAGKTSLGVSGRYTPIEALTRLLEASGLSWETINDSTVMLKAGPPRGAGPTKVEVT